MALILFVVPTTKTLLLPPILLTPSISFNSVESSREYNSEDPSSPSSRLVARASSSSKSKRHGAAALEREKMARIAASDPPSHLSRTSDARTFRRHVNKID